MRCVTIFTGLLGPAGFLALSLVANPAAADEAEPVEVSVYARFFYPTDPVRPTTRRSIEIMREDPGIRIVQWSGLSLPIAGSGHRRSSSRAPILMAIAGKSAPDIIESGFTELRDDVKQGLLFPLNEGNPSGVRRDRRAKPVRRPGQLHPPRPGPDVLGQHGPNRLFRLPEPGTRGSGSWKRDTRFD